MNSQIIAKKVKGESSKQIYNRAVNVLTGGVSRNTIYRKPHPYYVASAKGSYITDIDGTSRLDFANNMASLIHGHANPQIIEAVTNQLQKGTAYTMGTESEVDFAELLTSRAPGFEKIRFMNSGTEAVMTMIKAARAYTGKTKIAKAEGAYHGTYDFAEISQTSNPDNWGDINHPNSVPVVQNTPKGVINDVVVFPYNDIERTIKLLDENADNIACVLIDPVPHRVGLFPANDSFVKAVYNWTRKNNAILAFDEVVTFRVNYSGAQANYSVKPDLTALGKIIGGGFPIGALAGKAEIMEVLNPRQKFLRHPHSGTFSANPISTTAGRVAMEMFDENAVNNLNNFTSATKKQIEEALKIADVPVTLTGAGSMFRFHFTDTAPNTYRETYQNKKTRDLIDDLLDYMFFEENIVMINTLACMMATSMTQNDIDKFTDAIYRAMKFFKPRINTLNNG
ncbi:MAG: aspartate aminotransferase family protein [Ichthyobacteriaceae bacterium]|nr:aspartate aminotransferase family protein [Ichthyobacteriaceae bacterium]